MPRRLKLATKELGYLELYLIYENKGEYEPTWKPLQGSSFLGVVTVVSKETMDHALHGYTRPFVQQLGLAPSGCIRKLPTVYQQCGQREQCIFFDDTRCHPVSPKMPNCFEPYGVVPRDLGHEAIRLWHEGVYIVVVREG